MTCEELFLKELRSRGFRLTPQREMVLAVMHMIDRPVSVEEIFQKVHERFNSMDISTVYRTLDLLQDFGLVSAIDTGERQQLFEYIGIHQPHVHLACKSCGGILGVEIGDFKEFLTQVESTYAFEIQMDNATLQGICNKCRSQQ